MPTPIPPNNKGKKIHKLNAFTYGKLVALMLEGAYSADELSEKTGLHYVTVYEYCRELHNARAAHICEWRRDAKNRESIKIYKIGRGKDAQRFKYTPAERQARTRIARRALIEQSNLTFGHGPLSTLELRSEKDHEDGSPAHPLPQRA